MARVYDLVKDRRMIYSVDANSTVLEAARFMTEHNIGAVPVLRDGELAGIFSSISKPEDFHDGPHSRVAAAVFDHGRGLDRRLRR